MMSIEELWLRKLLCLLFSHPEYESLMRGNVEIARSCVRCGKVLPVR